MNENETTQGARVLEALGKVMKDTGTIPKTGWNDFHKYKYATEEDALDIIRPAMVKHGLILLPSCEHISPIDAHGNTHIVVEYHLAHTSGDILPFSLKMPGTGNDKNRGFPEPGGVGDKGTYKAMTGANKYALFKILQLATGDDPERDGQGGKSGDQKKQASQPPTPPENVPQGAPAGSQAPPQEEPGGEWFPENQYFGRTQALAEGEGLTKEDIFDYVKANYKYKNGKPVTSIKFLGKDNQTALENAIKQGLISHVLQILDDDIPF